MNRYLCLVFVVIATLVPVGVFAVTGTLTYNITSSSGGIACDLGPNYAGPIPPGAAAVGYNHCVMNFSFQTSHSFNYNGSTYDWTNVNSWMWCPGHTISNSLFGLTDGASSPVVPCSDVFVTTDPAYGNQALALTWTPTSTDSTVQLNSSSIFPMSIYIDWTYRIAQTSDPNVFSDVYMADDGPGHEYGSGGPFIEWDFIESGPFGLTNSSGPNAGEWNSGCDGAPCYPIVEPSTGDNQFGNLAPGYQTYGYRMTFNNQAQAAVCVYLNDVQVGSNGSGCGPVSQLTLGATDLALTYPGRLIIWGSDHPPYNVLEYFQSIVIWSCGPIGSGPCYTTPDTGTP